MYILARVNWWKFHQIVCKLLPHSVRYHKGNKYLLHIGTKQLSMVFKTIRVSYGINFIKKNLQFKSFMRMMNSYIVGMIQKYVEQEINLSWLVSYIFVILWKTVKKGLLKKLLWITGFECTDSSPVFLFSMSHKYFKLGYIIRWPYFNLLI